MLQSHLAEGIQQTHSLNFSKMEDYEMEVKKTNKDKEDFGEQMREEWKEFTKDSEKAMKEIKDTLADVGKDNRDNMVGWTVGGVIFGIALGVTVALVLLGYGISKAVD